MTDRKPVEVSSSFVQTDAFIRNSSNGVEEERGLTRPITPSDQRAPVRVNPGFEDTENPILTAAEADVAKAQRAEQIQAAFVTGALVVGTGVAAYFIIKWLWKGGAVELAEEAVKEL